jgi:hypothetical protein
MDKGATEMTKYEKDGIKWWNSMGEEDRRFWLRAALTATPADAWAYYKRVTK